MSSNLAVGAVNSRAFKPTMGLLRQTGNAFPSIAGEKNDVPGCTLSITPTINSTILINATFFFTTSQGTSASSWPEASGYLVVNGVVDSQRAYTYAYEGSAPYNVSAQLGITQTWLRTLTASTPYPIKLQVANAGFGTGHSVQTYTDFCRFWYMVRYLMAFVSNNMGLTVWNNPTDPFDYTELVDNWNKVDAHDHSGGPTGGHALAANSVGATQIQDNAVTAPKIPDGSIASAKIGAGVSKYQSGTFASRPAQPQVAGIFYYSTDTKQLFVSDGAIWRAVDTSAQKAYSSVVNAQTVSNVSTFNGTYQATTTPCSATVYNPGVAGGSMIEVMFRITARAVTTLSVGNFKLYLGSQPSRAIEDNDDGISNIGASTTGYDVIVSQGAYNISGSNDSAFNKFSNFGTTPNSGGKQIHGCFTSYYGVPVGSIDVQLRYNVTSASMTVGLQQLWVRVTTFG